MAAVSSGARMAHAQLEQLEAERKVDEGLRYEILNGELVIRGAPLTRHERVVRMLFRRFDRWAQEHGGEAFTALGVEMGSQQLIPDLTFVGPDRVDELDEDGFHVPPDLVAEVTSPGTRSLDLHEKRGIYESLGVDEYWVTDLTRHVVVVHRRGEGGAFVVTELSDGVVTTPLASGLEVPLAELFAQRPGS